MTPYRINEERTAERNFNEAHIRCRNIIERTNGVLKNKWRCLLGARELHYLPDKAIQITNVCCALHNICIHYKTDSTANVPIVMIREEEDDTNTIRPEIVTQTNSEYIAEAQLIRRQIATSKNRVHLQ